jgi:hypothetical protein
MVTSNDATSDDENMNVDVSQPAKLRCRTAARRQAAEGRRALTSALAAEVCPDHSFESFRMLPSTGNCSTQWPDAWCKPVCLRCADTSSFCLHAAPPAHTKPDT